MTWGLMPSLASPLASAACSRAVVDGVPGKIPASDRDSKELAKYCLGNV